MPTATHSNTETIIQGRKGRGRPRQTPKGRQVDPRALDEVCALLTDRSRRRDLLIEHLHLIQDHYGHLSAPHLARPRPSRLAQKKRAPRTASPRGSPPFIRFVGGGGRPRPPPP